MKMLLWSGMAVLLVVGCLLQSQSVAGEKKDKEPEKKKPLSKDVKVDAELNNTDVKDKVRQNSYCKTYTYKMVEGKTYTIDMKSADMDCYLRLENSKGEQVAEDDDSGGGLDAQIVYKAVKGGDFTIICTSFDGNETGKFVLTVKEAGGQIQPPKKGKLPPVPPKTGALESERPALAATLVETEISPRTR